MDLVIWFDSQAEEFGFETSQIQCKLFHMTAPSLNHNKATAPTLAFEYITRKSPTTIIALIKQRCTLGGVINTVKSSNHGSYLSPQCRGKLQITPDESSQIKHVFVLSCHEDRQKLGWSNTISSGIVTADSRIARRSHAAPMPCR